jgi:hypothetical protein
MTRILYALFLVLSLSTLLAQTPAALQIEVPEGAQPWTSLELNNDPENFQFAIVTDRTGGHRPGVFLDGVQKLNLLQPEFVMSVGDLIEGYTTDTVELNRQWEEFNGFVDQLEMPFFYVPGNHDITNSVMEQVWLDRYGQTHYYFVYHDVLFLCLNSEDQRRGSSRGTISDPQYEWIVEVLEAHPDVKWTLVFLHQPLWVQEAETLRWPDVERALAGRPHTVFAGHRHNYTKFERNDANYYMLATTGGGSSLRGPALGEFDHVVWVTMTDEGPVIANLLLEGIWDDEVATEKSKDIIANILQSNAIQIEPIFVDPSETPELFPYQVKLTNDQDVPMHVSFREGFSWDLVGHLEQSDWKVEPNSVMVVPFPVSIRSKKNLQDLKPLRLKADIRYEWEEDRAITVPMEFKVQPWAKQSIPVTDGPVAIDGDLREWESLRYSFEGNSREDLHLQYDLQHDDQFLYVAARVTDDEVLVDTARSIWSQDAIGLIVNSQPFMQSAMARGDSWYRDEVGIRISPEVDKLPSTVYLSEGTPETVRFRCIRSQNGFQLEAAIPIAELEQQQGTPWRTVRLNFLLDDFDQGFNDRDRYFAFPDWRRADNVVGSGMFFRK